MKVERSSTSQRIRQVKNQWQRSLNHLLLQLSNNSTLSFWVSIPLWIRCEFLRVETRLANSLTQSLTNSLKISLKWEPAFLLYLACSAYKCIFSHFLFFLVLVTSLSLSLNVMALDCYVILQLEVSSPWCCIVHSTEGVVTQWCSPLALQKKESGGQGSMPGTATRLLRHNEGSQAGQCLLYFCA